MSNLLNYTPWALVVGLFTQTFVQLYKGKWETIDYTHAYFILPVSLWLVWRKRKEIAGFVQSPQYKALSTVFFAALIALGALLFTIGWKWDYNFVNTFAIIPLALGMLGFLYGGKAAQVLLFPVLYLLLLVPPPLVFLDAITMPMRHIVTIVSVATLEAFNYPIVRDGLMILIGGKEIYMGPACSGFRSLITMISLGLVYAYIIKNTIPRKIVLFISVIPMAFLGNFARVTGVCLVTHHFGEDAGHKFHDTSGYVIFILLIFGLMGLEALLNKFAKAKK